MIFRSPVTTATMLLLFWSFSFSKF